LSSRRCDRKKKVGERKAAYQGKKRKLSKKLQKCVTLGHVEGTQNPALTNKVTQGQSPRIARVEKGRL